MKKLFMILSVVGVMSLATANVYAQEPEAEAVATEQVAEEAVAEEVASKFLHRFYFKTNRYVFLYEPKLI